MLFGKFTTELKNGRPGPVGWSDKKVVWKLGIDAFAAKKPGSFELTTGFVEHRIIGVQWLGAASNAQSTK